MSNENIGRGKKEPAWEKVDEYSTSVLHFSSQNYCCKFGQLMAPLILLTGLTDLRDLMMAMAMMMIHGGGFEEDYSTGRPALLSVNLGLPTVRSLYVAFQLYSFWTFHNFLDIYLFSQR